MKRLSSVVLGASIVGMGWMLSVPADAQTVLTSERVASGLSSPVYVTSPPGDRDRLFIVERRGTIKILKNGILLGTSFLDITGPVRSGGERGLLGLAFDPDYENTGHFFVCYTADVPLGDSYVSRFSVSATDPDVADNTSELVLLGPIDQPASNHNGGCIQIGPDGKLYIGFGDGGSSNDPWCNAQKGDEYLGKMLRINLDGSIPQDNPFTQVQGVLDEIWHFGHRNPWRFSFDRLNGDMYIGDVGQNAREEISFQAGTSDGGENYGWKVMEGLRCNSTGACPSGTPPCNDPAYTLPIHQYVQGGGTGFCVTGGYVYRGCGINDLQGTYFFADYISDKIWSFRYDGANKTDFTDRTTELIPNIGLIRSISSFGEDADGELYIVDLGGEVFKIVASDPAPAGEDLGFGLPGTDDLVPVLDACGQLNTGNSADVRLRNAKPSSTAYLLVSLTQGQTPFLGGTLVPTPPFLLVNAITTNSEGRIEFTVDGGLGPIDLYLQYLIEDAGAVQGFSFSNGLRLGLLP